MAKRKGQRVAPGKGSSSGRNTKSRTDKSIVRDTSTPVNVSSRKRKGRATLTPTPKHIKLPSGQVVFTPDLRGSTAERSLGALRYMRQFNLSFSEAAKLWHLRRDTFRKYAKSGLRTLKNGRVKGLANDRIRYTFQKPTTQAGIYTPIKTRSFEERQLFAQWLMAIEAAKDGDFSLIDAFPKNVFIDGTRLPTGHVEVQKIVEALEREGAKFEGPYRVRAVQS